VQNATVSSSHLFSHNLLFAFASVPIVHRLQHRRDKFAGAQEVGEIEQFGIRFVKKLLLFRACQI
jgi:hypothetical protein